MERRKLIKLGNSSYAIALPKSWVTKSGLKKGDEIFVIPNSMGELILTQFNKKINEEKKIVINVDNKSEEDINRDISSAYVKGYNLFYFIGKIDRDKSKIIKKGIQYLLSIEVIEENSNNIIAKDFFNMEDNNQESFIRRIDNNIREMFDLIETGYMKEKLSKIELGEINKVDDDINKFYFLSSRIMLKAMDSPALLTSMRTECVELFYRWWLCFNLEQIGDSIKQLATLVSKCGVNSKRFIDILSEIKNQYVNSIEAFYKEDAGVAKNTIVNSFKTKEKLGKIKDNDVSKIITNNLESIRKATYQNAKMVLYLKI